MAKIIKVGNQVVYRPRGERQVRTSEVEEIQITKNHDKMEGRIAKSCDLDEHKSVIITFKDGYWCWEDQICRIL